MVGTTRLVRFAAALAVVAAAGSVAGAAAAEPQVNDGAAAGAASPAQEAPASDASPSDEDSGLNAHLHRVAWVGFGAAAVGVATWLITGGIALGESVSLQDDCPDDVCPADRQDDLDTARTLSQVATVGLAVGVLGSIWGVTALLVADDDEEAAGAGEGETAATVQPLIGPGYFGMSGRF